MNAKSHLLVFNHVMDLEDPLLSHQLEIVLLLAKRFTQVTVVTGRVGLLGSLPPNVEVLSSKWSPGKPLLNLIRFYRLALPIILSPNTTAVFSHMADLQCALVSPITKLLHKRHCLWYAHVHESIYLKISMLFVDKIVTSTQGSFPPIQTDVHTIGQSIDPIRFKPNTSRSYRNIKRVLTYGRLDISKRADEIIYSVRKLRDEYPELTLTIVGSPGNAASIDWAKNLEKENPDKWLRFFPSVHRREIDKLVSEHDIFFHAYRGSLDKVLIEASLMEIPVVTTNSEYHRLFGSWNTSFRTTLISEYEGLVKLPPSKIRAEVKRRRDLALKNHSMEHWINQISVILHSGENSEPKSKK